MGAEVGTEVVCTCEAFGTERTLKSGRVLLDATLPVCAIGGRSSRVGELKDVIAVGDG